MSPKNNLSMYLYSFPENKVALIFSKYVILKEFIKKRKLITLNLTNNLYKVGIKTTPGSRDSLKMSFPDCLIILTHF